MAVILALALLVLVVSLGILAVQRRKRGLSLPPPKLSQEPIAVVEPTRDQLAKLKRFERQQKKIASGKRVFMPQEGHVWNPMRDYPRNARCTCGSGKKWKVCCSSKVPETIPAERAKNLRALVAAAKAGADVPAAIARARAEAAQKTAPAPGSREAAIDGQGGVSGQNSPGLSAHPAVSAPA